MLPVPGPWVVGADGPAAVTPYAWRPALLACSCDAAAGMPLQRGLLGIMWVADYGGVEESTSCALRRNLPGRPRPGDTSHISLRARRRHRRLPRIDTKPD